MLSARASSLARRDVEGFLRPLSAQARSVEEPIARASLQVPLSRPRFETSDPEKAATSPFHLQTDLTFTYDRMPADNVFRIPFEYDLEKSGNHWTVAASRLGASSQLPIWTTGAIQTNTSEHFLAFSRPDLPAAATAVARAEQARARLALKISFPMDDVHLVLVARDRAQYDTMTGRTTSASAVAQQETTFAITPTRIAPEGRLIVVNLERMLNDESTVETFQHELGHLALSIYTRPFTPGWVGESAAMYLADTRPADAWAQGTKRGAYEDISFANLTPRLVLGGHDATTASASYEYAYAAAAAWYLIETFGPDRYWEFYRSYSQISPGDVYRQIPDAGIGPRAEAALSSLATRATRDALQRIFDLTEQDLDARVRTWVRSRSR